MGKKKKKKGKNAKYRAIEKEHEIRRIQLLKKDSKAEEHFAELLNNANIFYVQEKCCYSKKGDWYYIDFYIPLHRLAIEIDGREHDSGWRKERDIKKTKFLKEKRNIFTVRYKNEDVLKMDKITMIEILRKANRTRKANPSALIYKQNEKKRELEELSKEVSDVVYEKIWIYDKSKDFKFHFNNWYVAQHSIGTPYKYIVNAFKNRSNVLASNLYIISDDEKELDRLIDEYYDYLWTKDNIKYNE